MEAVAWYGLTSPEREAQFRRAIDQALERLQEFPRSGTPTAGGKRWVGVPGFPYRLIYSIEGIVITIHAIPHDRQDPSRWKNR